MSQKFYKLSKDIAERRDLKPSDKIVFAIIADAIGDNGFCWPGVRTIAQNCGLTTTTVTNSIRRLEKPGLLTVDRRGRGKSTHYYIGESALKTKTVGNKKCVKKYDSGVLKSSTEAREEFTPNQTDLLNQTTGSNFSTFVLRNKKLWHLPQGKLNEYTEAFPKIDVASELRKAAQWLIDNPDRRKTARGMARFLGGWLGRAEPKPEPKRGDLDWLPSEEEAEELMAEVTS